jgi:hypothetical protein
MTNNLSNNSDTELRTLLQQSSQMLTSLADNLATRPDMQFVYPVERPLVLETHSMLSMATSPCAWCMSQHGGSAKSEVHTHQLIDSVGERDQDGLGCSRGRLRFWVV